MGREAARRELMYRLEEHLQDDSDQSIVLEAFFAPGKLQRRGVESLADEYNVRVRYIWCWAPRDESRDRIMQDRWRDGHERHCARMDFVEDAPGKYFAERPDEAAPRGWLDRACEACDDWPLEAPQCDQCDEGCEEAGLCAHCASREDVAYTCHDCYGRRRRRGKRGRGRCTSYNSYDDGCYY